MSHTGHCAVSGDHASVEVVNAPARRKNSVVGVPPHLDCQFVQYFVFHLFSGFTKIFFLFEECQIFPQSDISSTRHFHNQTFPQMRNCSFWGIIHLRKCPFEKMSGTPFWKAWFWSEYSAEFREFVKHDVNPWQYEDRSYLVGKPESLKSACCIYVSKAAVLDYERRKLCLTYSCCKLRWSSRLLMSRCLRRLTAGSDSAGVLNKSLRRINNKKSLLFFLKFDKKKYLLLEYLNRSVHERVP